MAKDDNAWVKDLFAARIQDWTPASAHGACRVLFAPASPDPEASHRCASVLSEAELQKGSSLLTEDGRRHFRQRRAFRRYCGVLMLTSRRPLLQIGFEQTGKGRPYLPEMPGTWFSFSACRHGFLGAWSTSHGIGVDVEDEKRNLDAVALARRYFARAEAESVEGIEDRAGQMHAFFQLWTLKEAALKSIGEGLPFGLEKFEFELSPSPRLVCAPPAHGGVKPICAYAIGKGDCSAALVMRSRT